MKREKRHLTDEMELLNQDKIRIPGEMQTYTFLGIKQVEMNEKLRKNISEELESCSR